MEASNTAWLFKRWALARFTGKVSPGLLYERCGLAYCRRRRWKVIARNRRWRGGEIDLLVQTPQKAKIIIEVRGRATADFLPRHALSPAKRRRLIWAAGGWRARVELLEVIGPLPTGFVARWFLGVWPELFGIRMQALAVD